MIDGRGPRAGPARSRAPVIAVRCGRQRTGPPLSRAKIHLGWARYDSHDKLDGQRPGAQVVEVVMPWTADRTTPVIHTHTGRRQCVSLINGIFGASVFLMPHHAVQFMRMGAQEQRHLSQR